MSSSLRLQSGCFDGLLVLPPLVLQLLLALARPLFASGSCFGFLQALTVVVDPGSSGSSPPSPPVFLQNGFHYHYFIIKICLREYFIANRERERDIQQTKTKQTSNSLKHWKSVGSWIECSFSNRSRWGWHVFCHVKIDSIGGGTGPRNVLISRVDSASFLSIWESISTNSLTKPKSLSLVYLQICSYFPLSSLHRFCTHQNQNQKKKNNINNNKYTLLFHNRFRWFLAIWLRRSASRVLTEEDHVAVAKF